MEAGRTSGKERVKKRWCDAEAVDRAAKACLRRKHGRPDAIAFRRRWGEEVLALARRIKERRYTPEPGIAFVTGKPKWREIHAATFRDRVVHHLLHQLLEPRLERSFIPDSFACRPGRGTHAAVVRLRGMMRDVTRQEGRAAWALKLDIRNFFNRIHKPTLLNLLKGRFTEEERVPEGPWPVLVAVVRQETAKTAHRLSPPDLFARVPEHKRLGCLGPDYGLPIGNLTSQLLANAYLDPLDHFVKRTLGVRHYVRYVDDFVLLHEDQTVLRDWERRIRKFLAARLQLEVHPEEELRRVNDGVDFLGYVIRPGYVLPRRRVVASQRERIIELEHELRPREVPTDETILLQRGITLAGPCRVWRIDVAAMESLRSVWASYEGHYRHADAWRLTRRLWQDHGVSQRLLSRGRGRADDLTAPPGSAGPMARHDGVSGDRGLSGGRSTGAQPASKERLRAPWPPGSDRTQEVGLKTRTPRASVWRSGRPEDLAPGRRFALPQFDLRFTSQVRRLATGIDGAILVMEVGCYAEVPHRRDVTRLGLNIPKKARGRFRAGVTWRGLPGLVERALSRGLRVALALEDPMLCLGLKQRELAYLIEPLKCSEATNGQLALRDTNSADGNKHHRPTGVLGTGDSQWS